MNREDIKSLEDSYYRMLTSMKEFKNKANKLKGKTIVFPIGFHDDWVRGEIIYISESLDCFMVKTESGSDLIKVDIENVIRYL